MSVWATGTTGPQALSPQVRGRASFLGSLLRPLVVPWTMDINTDPGRITDPNMVLSLDVTMALGVRTGH